MSFARTLPLAALVVVAGCVTAPPPAPPPRAAAEPPPRPGEISVDFEDVDLVDAVAAIAKVAGRPLRVDPEVHERVTIRLRKIPWRDCLDVIARMTRCEVTRRGRALVVEQPP